LTSRERGGALVAAVMVTLLVTAVGVGAWSSAQARLKAARWRLARAQAAWAGRGAVRVVASWFEAVERGSLVPPPARDVALRDRRRIDPDGDGAGPPWRDADPPLRVRYREGAGALFRPPDGPGAADRFLGTPDGPDVLLERGPRGAAALNALATAVAPELPLVLSRVALFRPPDRAGPRALATIALTAAVPVAGAGQARVELRGEAVAFDWDRLDRPLVVAGTARFAGEAGWRGGEAVIGGDLLAGGTVEAGWPGGIPWLEPDRPLRDDADGDGTADDADGDGTADLPGWRDAPGTVADPWWRGRVAGGWSGVAPAIGGCRPARPFAPRRSPPAAADKPRERSGLMVGCPASPEPVPPHWQRLAASGRRGALLAIEDPARPGLFRLDGIGPAVPPLALLPPGGGLLRLLPDPARSSTLTLILEGGRGAILVDRGPVALTGERRRRHVDARPAAPRDTAGADRPFGVDDERLGLTPAAPGCADWEVGAWQEPEPPPAASHCGERAVHWHGAVAVDGEVSVQGGVQLLGQLRAGALAVDGTVRAAGIRTPGAWVLAAGTRAGPPGAPRVLLTGLRERR
jgi:hypothetical protein